MLFDDFPNENSLKVRVHIFYLHVQSTLTYAAEIAEEGPDHLSDDDKRIYADLSKYLELASFDAEKLRRRVGATE